METETIAFSLLLLPLLSALVTLLFFRNSGNIASLLSVATSGGILVFSLFLIFQGENEAFVWQGTWIKLANWRPKVSVVAMSNCLGKISRAAAVDTLIPE